MLTTSERLELKNIRLFMKNKIEGAEHHPYCIFVAGLDNVIEGNYGKGFYMLYLSDLQDYLREIEQETFDKFQEIPYFEKPHIVNILLGIDFPLIMIHDIALPNLSIDIDVDNWENADDDTLNLLYRVCLWEKE